MLKNTQRAIVSMLIIIVINACTDENPVGNGTYEKGVFICNEGNFGNGTGTITFYDPTKDSTFQEIFEKENPGRVLGNVVQSISFFNQKGYIVVNNAAKTEVVDAKTFKSLGVIEGLANPRYFLGINTEKAYISQWGSDGISGSIAVVNLNNNSIIKTIPTGIGPERMIILNGYVYVCNGGAFNYNTFDLVKDSSITVINVETDEVSQTINLVNYNPNSIAIQEDGKLKVLCSGINDFNNPAANVNSSIVTFTLEGVISNLMLDAPGAKHIFINKKNKKFYFIDGLGRIMEYVDDFNISAFNNDHYYYSLGVNPSTGDIYAGDAKDYSSAGIAYIIGTNKVVKDSITCGIIPGNFWFQ